MVDYASLSEDLSQQKEAYLYRRRQLMQSPQGAVVKVDGRECYNFCSNDYLGLANHPRLIDAFKTAANEYGVGSGAAHLITGQIGRASCRERV